MRKYCAGKALRFCSTPGWRSLTPRNKTMHLIILLAALLYGCSLVEHSLDNHGTPSHVLAHNDPMAFIPNSVWSNTNPFNVADHLRRGGRQSTIYFERSCLNSLTPYNEKTKSLQFSLSPAIGVLRKAVEHTDANLNIASTSKGVGIYTGQNIFGATGEIVKIATRKIDIGWKAGDVPRSALRPGSRLQVPEFQFAVPFSQEEAIREGAIQWKTEKSNITCVILFEPKAPYTFDYVEYSTPTLTHGMDTRTEGTVIIGRISEIWVVNKRTQKLIAVFK